MKKALVINMPRVVLVGELSRNFGDFDSDGMLKQTYGWEFAVALEEADAELGKLYCEVRTLRDVINAIHREAQAEAGRRTGVGETRPSTSSDEFWKVYRKIVETERGEELADKERRKNAATAKAQQYISENYN